MTRVACADETSNAEIKTLADRIRAGRGGRLPDFCQDDGVENRRDAKPWVN